MAQSTSTVETTAELEQRGSYIGGPPALNEGDAVLWLGRASPLDVFEAAHVDGEHSDPREVAVKGPRGGVVTLSRKRGPHSHSGNTWHTSSDGAVESVVRVDEAPLADTLLGDPDEVFHAEDWSDPTDDCPHCGHMDRFTTQDFSCQYLTGAMWGGADRAIERTDSGYEKRLVYAECINCGGTVYRHPAYVDLFVDGMDAPPFPHSEEALDD